MIEGLKLTMTGEQLIARVQERIQFHEASADGDERRRARVQTLTLIRDHLVLDEVYRLGEYDLRFADLLPDDDWLDCGCLGRWRHEEEEAPETVLTAGATRPLHP